MYSRRISVLTLPSADETFTVAIRRLLAGYLESAQDEPTTSEFEAIVRAQFPGARVRARDPLAEFSEHQPAVWYVQREAGVAPVAERNGHSAWGEADLAAEVKARPEGREPGLRAYEGSDASSR